jgi:hypothetical protein
VTAWRWTIRTGMAGVLVVTAGLVVNGAEPDGALRDFVLRAGDLPPEFQRVSRDSPYDYFLLGPPTLALDCQSLIVEMNQYRALPGEGGSRWTARTFGYAGLVVVRVDGKDAFFVQTADDSAFASLTSWTKDSFTALIYREGEPAPGPLSGETEEFCFAQIRARGREVKQGVAFKWDRSWPSLAMEDCGNLMSLVAGSGWQIDPHDLPAILHSGEITVRDRTTPAKTFTVHSDWFAVEREWPTRTEALCGVRGHLDRIVVCDTERGDVTQPLLRCVALDSPKSPIWQLSADQIASRVGEDVIAIEALGWGAQPFDQVPLLLGLRYRDRKARSVLWMLDTQSGELTGPAAVSDGDVQLLVESLAKKGHPTRQRRSSPNGRWLLIPAAKLSAPSKLYLFDTHEQRVAWQCPASIAREALWRDGVSVTDDGRLIVVGPRDLGVDDQLDDPRLSGGGTTDCVWFVEPIGLGKRRLLFSIADGTPKPPTSNARAKVSGPPCVKPNTGVPPMRYYRWNARRRSRCR